MCNTAFIISVLFLSFSGAINFKDRLTSEHNQWKCNQNAYPPNITHKVPTWIVDLDEPAHERWKNISIFYRNRIKGMLDNVKEFLRQLGTLGRIILGLIDGFAGKLMETLPSPYKEEIFGISKYCGINLGEIVLYNMFYELTTLGWCVSLVAQDTKGELYLARNLDFGLHADKSRKSITDVCRPLLINVHFVKGGKVLFKSVNFAGYIGSITSIRPKAFSLALNTRQDPNDDGFIGVVEWILGKRTGKWAGFLAREIMLHARNYQQARTMLTKAELVSPIYFILAGNKAGEGCVITRSRNKTLDVWEMSQSGGWYIIESNYDHWKPTPPYDVRRNVTKQCLLKMTQKGVSKSGIFDILSTHPICNGITTSTSVMKASTGLLETWEQFCVDY